ncbi:MULTISPECIES: Hsp20/alpha crystallin family protein [Methylococcus]|uniref:Hsp20/alpha crystallin family protein n=1 Tax=Methylococcus capsulatus TaxID=414 RepID=A0ABZ2F5M0_METCP|nr:MULTISPECIES: Hsp20/alpha crystallin family protein [Methylococcus]MDF9392073.1 Hsp20/alpha crystallin family protein [Methylococcus capsulatus]
MSNGKQDIAKREDVRPALLPAVDIVEDETGISLTADLPGVPKEKLTVRMDGQSLSIEGEIALETPEGMEASYVEVRSPVYRRSFSLSRDLDPAKIDAQFKDGVLRLRIPKAEHAQPRKIAISVD